MNKKIETLKENGVWKATLVEYNAFPFGTIPDNTVDSIEAESFSELMKEIGNKNWIDEVNKNI